MHQTTESEPPHIVDRIPYNILSSKQPLFEVVHRHRLQFRRRFLCQSVFDVCTVAA